jgi:hypothetical protein
VLVEKNININHKRGCNKQNAPAFNKYFLNGLILAVVARAKQIIINSSDNQKIMDKKYCVGTYKLLSRKFDTSPFDKIAIIEMSINENRATAQE